LTYLGAGRIGESDVGEVEMRNKSSLNVAPFVTAIIAFMSLGVSPALAQAPDPDPPVATVVADAVPITTSIDPVLISSVNTPVEAAISVYAGHEMVNGVAVALQETHVLACELDGTISSTDAQMILQYLATGGTVHAFREDASGQGWIVLSYTDEQGGDTTDYLSVNSQSLQDWYEFFLDWLTNPNNGTDPDQGGGGGW